MKAEDTFTVDGAAVDMTKPAANIFAFCAFMSARVAKQRGGSNSDYLAECADFMVDVIGKRLSVADPLPDGFDWTPTGAIECAEALLEYDS